MLVRACRAHAAYFADWTEAQWEPLTSGEREAASDRMAADLDNIRDAWRHWVREKDFEQLGKLTDSLWLLYDARGWYHATVSLTTDLLEVLSPHSLHARTRRRGDHPPDEPGPGPDGGERSHPGSPRKRRGRGRWS